MEVASPLERTADNEAPLVVKANDNYESGRLTLSDLVNNHFSALDGLTKHQESEEAYQLTAQWIYDIIRRIRDPEYPLTLEELKVVNKEDITVQKSPISGTGAPYHHDIEIKFTPTVPHCSQATLIGLIVKVLVQMALPVTCRVTVRVKDGTHKSEVSINKQLADKERVFAASENPNVLAMIMKGVSFSTNFDLDELLSRHTGAAESGVDKMIVQQDDQWSMIAF